jgi:rhodanese-related sulfurtransferase
VFDPCFIRGSKRESFEEGSPMFGSGSRPEVGSLTVVELKDRLDRGASITVLDVREDHERAFCAIPLPPTARDLHIPMRAVTSRLDDLRATAGSDPIVVYCHHGVRSLSVADWLARQGVQGVYNLTEGIDAWSERVDPGVPRY